MFDCLFEDIRQFSILSYLVFQYPSKKKVLFQVLSHSLACMCLTMISSLLYDIVVFSLQTTVSWHLLWPRLSSKDNTHFHQTIWDLDPSGKTSGFPCRVPPDPALSVLLSQPRGKWASYCIFSAVLQRRWNVSQSDSLPVVFMHVQNLIWTAFSFISRLAIGTNRGFALVDSATNRCLYILSNIASILCTCSPHNVLYIAWKFCKVGQELISGGRGNYFLSTYHGYSLYM